MKQASFHLSNKEKLPETSNQGKHHEQNQTQWEIIEGGVRRPVPRKETSALPAHRLGDGHGGGFVLHHTGCVLSHRSPVFFNRALERLRQSVRAEFCPATSFPRPAGDGWEDGRVDAFDGTLVGRAVF